MRCDQLVQPEVGRLRWSRRRVLAKALRQIRRFSNINSRSSCADDSYSVDARFRWCWREPQSVSLKGDGSKHTKRQLQRGLYLRIWWLAASEHLASVSSVVVPVERIRMDGITLEVPIPAWLTAPKDASVTRRAWGSQGFFGDYSMNSPDQSRSSRLFLVCL